MKTEYYLELLTPETIKLLRSNKSKITEIENGENVSHLEITEVVLTTIISKIQESCIHLFLINHSVNYLIFFLKIL